MRIANCFLLGFFIAAMQVWVPQLEAAPIAYDNFNSYTAGSDISGGSGGSGPWAGNWSGGAGTATVQSGVIPSFGNSLQLSANSQNIASRQFTAQTGDEVYVGLLLRTNSSFSDNDFLQIYVNNAAGSGDTNGDGMSGGVNTASNKPYFVRKGGASNTTLSSTLHPNETTQSLVLRFSKSVSGAANKYDQIAIFVNQASAGTPDAFRGAADADNTTTVATMSRFSLRTANLDSGDLIWIDELKIATTYAEAYTAVPEPGAWLLAASGGLGLLFISRHYRRARAK